MYYEDARVEIVLFHTEDVICSSNQNVEDSTDSEMDNWGKEDWDN